MVKKRMTFEKHQRDAKKKRKAEEKREVKRRKREFAAQEASLPSIPTAAVDESTDL